MGGVTAMLLCLAVSLFAPMRAAETLSSDETAAIYHNSSLARRALQAASSESGGCLPWIDLTSEYADFQLAEQLSQHRPLVVFAGGPAGLAVALRLLRSSWPHRGRPNTASPGQ
mgnify:CR=1 FL=1